jgi:tRNA pseudouridine13 synthase
MKRKRGGDPDDVPPLVESDVGITAFRSDAQHRAVGLFQSRWADFHVREIGESGQPLSLTALPTGVPDADILSFVLYKENRTTADAIQQVATCVGASPHAFNIMGSKDKRAVTVQEVTCQGLRHPARLLKVNEKWTSNGSRVRIGHIREAHAKLSLSQGRGNRFVVVLREVELVDEGSTSANAVEDSEAELRLRAVCSRTIDTLRSRGFINYFGMQRFGNDSSLPTHVVGAALLRRNFLAALKLVLNPRQAGLKPAVQEALRIFEATGSAKDALRRLPPRGFAIGHRLLSAFLRASSSATPHVVDAKEGEQSTTAPEAAFEVAGAASGAVTDEEAAAIASLKQVPRRQLLLYANALQALAFNHAATFRLRSLDASKPVEGDLVWGEGGGTHPACETSASVVGAAAGSVADAEVETAQLSGAETSNITAQPFTRAPQPPPVHQLSAAEAASGRFTLEDVLLPLPGHSVVYPGNAVAAQYSSVLESVGLSEDVLKPDSETLGNDGVWFMPGLFDLPGGYRPLIAHASDLNAELIPYTDHTLSLEALDVDRLEDRASRSSEAWSATEPRAAATAATAAAAATAATAAAAAAAAALPTTFASPPLADVTQRWAWKLSFTLPSSVYATMVLREVLHEPLDIEAHSRRSKALLLRTGATSKGAPT